MILPKSAFLVLATLFAAAGCNSYRYLRDSTPQLEQMRYEYVRGNPGGKYNNDILAGRVMPGMSRLQVRVTWGDPDQVRAGSTPGIDQIWSYAENEPSRGTSVYELHFTGEVLEGVEIQRAALVLNTSPTATEKPLPSDSGPSVDVAGKPQR
ncbi:MAG TPA: hypothetical protein VE964_03415 [Myxococcales bacterium]|nr:hypothetical protein [Myxococcales bacterium]